MRNWLFSLILVAPPILPAVGAADGDMEILRDPWGVPHVSSGLGISRLLGWGYACAEDRRLQMELFRRKGAGRLAEVFGPEWVQSDREARIAGYTAYAGEAFAKLPAEMQAWLGLRRGRERLDRGESRGGNAAVQAPGRRSRAVNAGRLPAGGRAVLSLGSPFDDQALTQYHRFQELAAQIGEAEAEKQFHMAVEDTAAIVSEAEMAKDAAAYQRLKARPRMPGFLLHGVPAEGPKMSHAWAIAGSRSKTGKPLLESDPQLPLASPPFLRAPCGGRDSASGRGTAALCLSQRVRQARGDGRARIHPRSSRDASGDVAGRRREARELAPVRRRGDHRPEGTAARRVGTRRTSIGAGYRALPSRVQHRPWRSVAIGKCFVFPFHIGRFPGLARLDFQHANVFMREWLSGSGIAAAFTPSTSITFSGPI